MSLPFLFRALQYCCRQKVRRVSRMVEFFRGLCLPFSSSIRFVRKFSLHWKNAGRAECHSLHGEAVCRTDTVTQNHHWNGLIPSFCLVQFVDTLSINPLPYESSFLMIRFCKSTCDVIGARTGVRCGIVNFALKSICSHDHCRIYSNMMLIVHFSMTVSGSW
jgi:hypothetical protein